MWFYREHTHAHTPAALQRTESAGGVWDRGSYTVPLGRIRSWGVRDGWGLQFAMGRASGRGGPRSYMVCSESHHIVPNRLPSTLPHTQIPTSVPQLLILDLLKKCSSFAPRAPSRIQRPCHSQQTCLKPKPALKQQCRSSSPPCVYSRSHVLPPTLPSTAVGRDGAVQCTAAQRGWEAFGCRVSEG